MLKMIEKFAQIRKEKPDFFEATKFVQERIDLYVEENVKNIQRVDAEHNETGRSLSGQLITFSTLAVGLTSLVFAQNKLLQNLDGYQKSFLYVGLVSFFFSILAGALEHWDAMKHFKNVASLYSRANTEAPIETAQTIKDLHDFRSSLLKDYPTSSRSRGLIAQVALLSLGAILYLILFATIIFGKA